MLVREIGSRKIMDGWYRLEEDVAYRYAAARGGVLWEFEIRVARGFLYDAASVPRLLWTCSGMTPDGLQRLAALLHDFLYRHKGVMPPGSSFERPAAATVIGWAETPRELRSYTRRDADRLFARAMRECEVERAQRRRFYRGVRIGGWKAWRRPARELEVID